MSAAKKRPPRPNRSPKLSAIPAADGKIHPLAEPRLLWLLLITLACLLPFINKAFHIDDTLFLRAAEQIQKHPADFYGFRMNWFGMDSPMITVFDNPPLTSYGLALAATLLGWSERALHLSFLLPALAAAWGIYLLAANYCRRPFLAALAAIVTPVFLVSATTLMCDVPLLAFWVWSVVLFERGLKKGGLVMPLAAGTLAGLAVMTKFTGLALVPLMLADGVMRRRRPGWWLIAPLLPVLFAVGYECITRRMYGEGLLLAAFKYSSTYGEAARHDLPGKLATGLSFTGGSFLPLLFFLPWLWPWRRILAALCIILPLAILSVFTGPFNHLRQIPGEPFRWEPFVEGTIFVAVGIGVLVLTAADCFRQRDPDSALLLMWVAGIFVFATIVNWTTNGRSLLPMLPAFGILLARQLDRHGAGAPPKNTVRYWWAALPAALLSLLVVKADYDIAGAGRAAATELYARCREAGASPATIWFQGHWGFQYYMEKLGARHTDPGFPSHAFGQWLVLPATDTGDNVHDIPAEMVRLIAAREYPADAHLATMNPRIGAAFYASIYGPLPFAAAWSIPPRCYYLFKFIRPWTLEASGESQSGALELQHDLEARAAQYRAALAANPNDQEARFQLGLFLLSRGNPDEAVENFAAILRTHPDDGPAHLQLARLTDDLRDPAAAVAHYRAALRALPDSVEALDNLAWLLATNPDARQRNGAEAVQLAARADQLLGNNSAPSAGMLAAAYAEAQQFPDAVAAANRAVALAEASGDNELADANRERLALYQAGRPFHREAR